MSFLSRIRSDVEARAGSTLGDLASGARSSVSGMTQQVKSGIASDIKAPFNLKNTNPGMLADAAFNTTDPMSLLGGTAFGRLQEDALVRVQRAKAMFKPPPGAAGNEAIPTGLGTSRLWGNQTFDEHRASFLRAASLKRSWKNIFHVEVKEYKPTKESFTDADGLFNLLALDVSMSPYTIPGEAVPVGSANLDKVAGAERVEIRLTTMDDERGSIKRWFMAKCDQAARKDGSFGLPADYLLAITLTHMASAAPSKGDPRFSQRYLMRPVNIDLELSRRGGELEELPLTFAEFDTFMEAP